VATHAGIGAVRAEPFEEVEISLDFLWGDD
jgi:hypothetical protein